MLFTRFWQFPSPSSLCSFQYSQLCPKTKTSLLSSKPSGEKQPTVCPRKTVPKLHLHLSGQPQTHIQWQMSSKEKQNSFYVLHYSSEKALKAIGTTSLYYWSGTQNGWTQSYLILTQIALHARPFTRRMHLCNHGDSLVVFCRHKLYLIIKSHRTCKQHFLVSWKDPQLQSSNSHLLLSFNTYYYIIIS